MLDNESNKRWLSNQRSYKVNCGFEKRLNKAIYDTLNGHGPFNIYKMKIDFLCKIKYYVIDICR